MYFLVKRQFHAHCLATSFLYQGPAPPHSERMTFLPALLRKGFPGGHSGKDLPASAGRCKRHGFNPWVGKIPWRRAWQPTPVFLPGESHGQRSLAGYMGSHSQTWLKQLSTHAHTWLRKQKQLGTPTSSHLSSTTVSDLPPVYDILTFPPVTGGRYLCPSFHRGFVLSLPTHVTPAVGAPFSAASLSPLHCIILRASNVR